MYNINFANMVSKFTKTSFKTQFFSKTVFLFFSFLLLSAAAKSQYCTSGFFSSGCAAFGDQINGFSTTGGSTNISNLNSGCSSGSYGSFLSQIYTGPPSGTVNFTINNNPNYGEYYDIYVDWNQDGDFADAGEKVYSAYLSSNQTASSTFTIPVTATPGLTRLRVFANYGSYAANSCSGSTWGEVEDYGFYIAGNCNAPASINPTLIGSMSVDFNWAAVTGSLGYEYAVTTSATGPTTGASTTTTSAVVSGLTPSTQYYIHVRNRCAGYPSVWTTLMFTTLPPCIIATPPGISVPYVDSNSANVAWQAVGTGIEYDYIVQLDTTAPLPNAKPKSTTSNQINLTALQSGKTYFFFLRVRCVANDTSGWIMDSIYVPIPCRAPDVKINDLNSTRAVAYWDAPTTAYKYKIINSAVVIPNPSAGLTTDQTSYLYSYLDEGKLYYIYAKSYCKDRDIFTESQWATSEYTTWALDVDNVTSNSSLHIYPNPVDNHMVIDLPATGQKGNISIIDITGRMLKTFVVNDAQKSLDVDLGDLPSGTYVLQYVNNDTTEQVKFSKL